MIRAHAKKILILSCIFFGILQFTHKTSSEAGRSQLNKKAVVFDIGEVLVRINKTQARHFLGTQELFRYVSFDWKNPASLKNLLYDILYTENKCADSLIFDYHGNLLPTIVCDMLKGTRDELQCYNDACLLIEQEKHRFCSKREHMLCLKSAEIIFNPERLATILEPHPEGLKLLQECHKQGHEIFILSNFGKKGYEQLKILHPQLFELVKENNIIISAHVNSVKPEPQIYQHLIKKIQQAGILISPETVFFIDDQKENVIAAQNHSITGIHKKDFKSVRKQLHSLAILKKA